MDTNWAPAVCRERERKRKKNRCESLGTHQPKSSKSLWSSSPPLSSVCSLTERSGLLAHWEICKDNEKSREDGKFSMKRRDFKTCSVLDMSMCKCWCCIEKHPPSFMTSNVCCTWFTILLCHSQATERCVCAVHNTHRTSFAHFVQWKCQTVNMISGSLPDWVSGCRKMNKHNKLESWLY